MMDSLEELSGGFVLNRKLGVATMVLSIHVRPRYFFSISVEVCLIRPTSGRNVATGAAYAVKVVRGDSRSVEREVMAFKRLSDHGEYIS